MFDLVVSGGSVVSASSTTLLDLGILSGKVVAVSQPSSLIGQAKRTIDASGLYVLPGAIDPHTHISDRWQGHPAPGFGVISVAAAHGGTTTFIDFAPVRSGDSVSHSIEERRAQADGMVAIDYSLHVGLGTHAVAEAEKVGEAVTCGLPSFGEINLTGKGGMPPDDGSILALLRQAAKHGGIAGFHAENGALVNYYAGKLTQEGKTSLQYFPQSRPNIVEFEAVKRVILLAEEAGAAVCFFHLSTKQSLLAVAEARARGFPVYAEACPHYLAFNDEVYRQENAIEFVRFPPMRSAADQAALWQAVADGTVSWIGTDHSGGSLALKKKLAEGKPFTELPGGMGQIETRLGFMYSEGVVKGRITVNRLVELVSENPALIFGLYPQKGALSVGSDADIVLLDPKAKKQVTASDLHMGLDYTPFEDWLFTGDVVMTIARGKVIVENGDYLGSLSDGRFLKRSISPEILSPHKMS